MQPAAVETFAVKGTFPDQWGMVKIPTGPGWGTELNEKAAAKYAFEG